MTQFRSRPEEPKKEEPGARAVIEKHADALDEVLEKSKEPKQPEARFPNREEPKPEAKKADEAKAAKKAAKDEAKEEKPKARTRVEVLRDLVEDLESDKNISDAQRYDFQELNRRLTRALAS